MARRKRSPRTTGRRRAPSGPGTDYDSPWKEALDRYFEQCMAFFFPEAHADIDWGRGYKMLDKELQPIVRQSKQRRRYVDKLVEVWLKSGEERWLLIHVEVQTWKEGDLPKRMYVYNHRIFDRYDREVISLAILADDDPDWRPSQYEYGRWGFHTRTTFPTVKLMDYAARDQALEAHPNPFAMVVLAHLKTLDTRRSAAERYAWKLRLVKSLYERGMEPEAVRQLFRFIDWIMDLPVGQEWLFWQEITTYQQEKRMPFVTIAEQVGMGKGFLKGIEKCLKLKFGAEGLELMPEIREIQDHVLLGEILDAIETVASTEDLRKMWKRGRRSYKERRK
ncbi:MAG: cytosolic protein [Isosphaeraceae bacterium]